MQGSTAVLTVNPHELSGDLGSAQDQTVIVKASADDVELVLPAQAVQTLLQGRDLLELDAPDGSYTLPLQSLPLADLASQLNVVSGAETGLQMAIQPAPNVDKDALSAAFGSDGLVGPVTFAVTASANGKSVTVVGSDTVGVVLVNGTPEHARTTISGSMVSFFSETDPIYAVVSHRTNFSDIAGLPQAAAIEVLSDKLVINGFTKTTFEPQGGVTRAQFAAYMVRALGLWNLGTSLRFSDVSAGFWAAPVIRAAAAEKFIKGFPDGRFRPADQITNEQMAAIVARAMAYLGIAQGAESAQPKDAAAIPAWARSDAQLALSQGIMTLNAHGDFQPSAVTTRAQAAAIIWNLMRRAGIA